MAYVYKEYPKWIKTPEGYEVIVKNAEEEAKLVGKKEENKVDVKKSDVTKSKVNSKENW